MRRSIWPQRAGQRVDCCRVPGRTLMKQVQLDQYEVPQESVRCTVWLIMPSIGQDRGHIREDAAFMLIGEAGLEEPGSEVLEAVGSPCDFADEICRTFR